VAHRHREEAVDGMCGGVQGLCLVANRERRLKEKEVVRMMRSTRPFYGEVEGYERHNLTPWVRNKE
jgi:hypothetical protein